MLSFRTVLLCAVCAVVDGQPLINVEEFTLRIQELGRDALGKDYIQELIDNEARFSKELITEARSSQLADELSDTLSSRFAKYFTALERITTTAQKGFAADKFHLNTDYDDTFLECCNLREQDLEYDARFFTKADSRSLCYRVSQDSPATFTVPATPDMLQVMKQNFLETPTLKWQYFGTEEGIQLKFPAHVSANCGNYDPRFRPYYVESSSPVAKDLVVVIDSSGSMETNGRMDLAKNAAMTVVDTLNPNDRIGIVRFSSTASTPPGNHEQSLCYNTDIAYAIPDNVRYLKSYIQDIQAFGQTAYLAALETAFDLLLHVEDVPDQKRDKVILFLTDGEPTDSEKDRILYKIRDLNYKMKNTVTIMTYGLQIANGTDDLLLAMARQEKSNSRNGDVNVGVFTKIDSVENLRLDLGSYYSHFSSRAALEKPVISVPYVGFSGLGLITSICDTVLHAGQLKGVSCVDVRIADIIGDIAYAQPGEYSYTFIIDRTGRTLVHPLMPNPFKTTDDPMFIDISVLERSRGAQDVISAMKSGGSGQRTFLANFTIGMGQSMKHGVEVKPMQAIYQYRQIRRSNLSFCMVFATSDVQMEISVPGNTASFLFHRFDLKEPENMCSTVGRLATTDKSSVAFSDEAYADVLLKDSTSLTAEDITKMNNYMMTTRYRWDALKAGVKDSVVLTEKMDAFWKTHNAKYGPYVSSRYIGTNNGMFRIYPGLSLSYNYSHTQRAWYSEGVAQRDKLVISVPYKDAFRAGYVTSIMHSILEGKQSHSASDIVIGVVGADFNSAYIRYLIMDTYPQCHNDRYICFLMDESGYMVFHPSIADESTQEVNRHIIRHEPEIAKILIDTKRMVREACVSLGEHKAWFTWKVREKGPIERKSSFLTFELQWVTGTDVFLGIKDKSSQPGSSACRCPDSGGKEFLCSRTDSTYCECPCYAIADYDYCSNSFHQESLPPKTCTPPKESSQFDSPVVNENGRANKLPACFPVKCKDMKDRWKCPALPGCAWCPISAGGEFLCSNKTLCVSPVDTKSVVMKSSNAGVIAGAVVAVVVIVAIVIVIVYLVLKKRSQPQITEIIHPNQSYDYKYRPAASIPGDSKPPPLPPLRDDGYLRMSKAPAPKHPEESIYHEIPASGALDSGQEDGQVSFPGYNDEPVGYEVPAPSGYAVPPPRPHTHGPQ